MKNPSLPVAERLVQLLKHLGIERAHVAAAVPGDWRSLATSYADRLASLSLVCPTGFDPSAVSSMTSRVLVFHGDRGPTAERVRAGGCVSSGGRQGRRPTQVSNVRRNPH